LSVPIFRTKILIEEKIKQLENMKLYQQLKILTLALTLVSCSNSHDSSKSIALVVKPVKNSKKLKIHDPLAAPKNLYLKNDSAFIIIDKTTYCIPKAESIDFKNSFPAIYEINKDSIKKSDGLDLHRFIYFTTYDDVGMGYRGYLYVFDTRKKILIKDRQFKHNYLYSSAAIFVIDRRTNKIFSIDKPGWYDKKNTAIVSASMYSIAGNKFKFFKNIYDSCGDAEDTSIIRFYRRSLMNNGKHGKVLPENWWK